MLREIAVEIYLFIFRLFFTLFKLFPIKSKTTFVTSFSGNAENLVIGLSAKKDENHQIVILKMDHIYLNFPQNETIKTLKFNSINHFLQSIYHLATSQYVIVDNYYGFLAATNFKKNVTCVQIWHAVGAFKKFGLMDQTNLNRSKRAIKRFNTVYQRFDKVAIGSNHMKKVFIDAFGLLENRFLTTGIPRTDFFFNEGEKKSANKRVQNQLSLPKGKKVLLYAPTYRDGEFNDIQIHINFKQMYENLNEDYVLLLRLHPAVKYSVKNNYLNFVYDVSNYESINDLLIKTDILITDYSSIPFEFSLLNKPMIFYAYDLEEYKNKRGLWGNFSEIVPGPIVKTTNELIQTIKQNKFDTEKIKLFANEWNKFNKGNSSEKLIEAIYNS